MTKKLNETFDIASNLSNLSEEEIEIYRLVEGIGIPSQNRLNIDSITEHQKEIATAKLEQRVYRAMQRAYARLESKHNDISYKKISERLDISPSIISKRLSGHENMTIRSIAETFLALEADIDIVECPVSTYNADVTSHSNEKKLRQDEDFTLVWGVINQDRHHTNRAQLKQWANNDFMRVVENNKDIEDYKCHVKPKSRALESVRVKQ
ncbi:hypothetical protein [Azospirillum sp. B506]|uniref:hypothetical protein n=1 Tax=Azospirillum sp. B506 TaxID=137721 RepID=UPI0011DE2871|nr:hypothetical protein [Azospirillum sp. B506]